MSLSTPRSAGGRLKKHPLPPDGFDAQKASPRELRRYGLPPRPDPAMHPGLAALWVEVFSRKLTYITPTFRPLQELVPGIERRGRPRKTARAFAVDVPHQHELALEPAPSVATVTSPTWAGGVVHATGSETFTWVLGRWNVPDVAPGAQGQGSWVSSAWIGIDGDKDVTQIGTIQSVSADADGHLTKDSYAWYEWYPHTWCAITNFPVSFGDTLLGLVCLLAPTEAWFSLVNTTSRIHAGFPFTAPAGTVSLENQAEWIMERPEVKGTNGPLPNFGEIYFDSAMGGSGLDFLVDGGTDTAINMVENGTTVATTTIETPTLIKIAYTGG